MPNGKIRYTDPVRRTLELDLQSSSIKSANGLQVFRNLEVLDLSGNQLTDVKGLENLTQLTELHLSGQGFGRSLTSVKGLEKLTQLKYLNLGSNKLTDVRGLEKLTQLRVLHLSDNPDLTKAQIDELQKALPKCKIYSNRWLTSPNSK